MIKNNNIDIFLSKEDLSNIFFELLPQLKNKELNFISQLNINDDLSKINLNQITILDEDSLKNFINKSYLGRKYNFERFFIYQPIINFFSSIICIF